MNQHIYLRAYMAGIVVPAVFLLVVATVFTIARYVYNVPVPIERVIVFPMAVVPNVWGLWNILFIALRSRLHLSIGLHGALLPFLLAPLGMALAGILEIPVTSFATHALPLAVLALPFVWLMVIIAYYLVWKYIVAFLNRVVGLM